MINTLPQSLIDTVTTILESQQPLNWAVGDNAGYSKEHHGKQNKIVWLNANEVLPKVAPDMRVTPTDKANHIGNRMERAITHFQSGKFMDPADVSINTNNPAHPIWIDNGRHRIAASLSLGHEWFPASVAPHEIEHPKQHLTVKDTI